MTLAPEETEVDGEYNADTYIKTVSGSMVSRSVTMCAPTNVQMPGGKSVLQDGVVVRGDFAPIEINRYTVVGKGTVLRPSGILTVDAGAGVGGKLRFVPLTIGKYTFIGRDCVVECASVGVGCFIGDGSVLCKGAILKDYVHVRPGTIVPPDLVIPPFSVVSGQPARITGEAPPSTPDAKERNALSRYRAFMHA